MSGHKLLKKKHQNNNNNNGNKNEQKTQQNTKNQTKHHWVFPQYAHVNDLGQVPNCTIRKNKPLVLRWAIFYFRQSYLHLLVLICAKISVCGFRVFLHHVISSPELFFLIVILNFCFRCVMFFLFFFFFMSQNKASVLICFLYFLSDVN